MLASNPVAGSPTVRAHLFPEGVSRVLATPDYQLPQLPAVPGMKRGLGHVHEDDQVLLVSLVILAGMPRHLQACLVCNLPLLHSVYGILPQFNQASHYSVWQPYIHHRGGFMSLSIFPSLVSCCVQGCALTPSALQPTKKARVTGQAVPLPAFGKDERTAGAPSVPALPSATVSGELAVPVASPWLLHCTCG